MREARALRWGAIVACVVLPTCAGPTLPDDPEVEEGVGPFTAVACPSFALASSSGLPLERVAIGDVPATLGSPVAAVLLDDDGEPYGFAYVLEGDGGALELSVPLHPLHPVDGGSVTLAFTDGARACPAVAFAIEPLPQADGELAAVVGLLQALVADQLEVLGSTPEELRDAAIEDVPPSLWSLALVQTLLDDPEDETSLLALAEGAAADEALDLVDRLLARTGMRESLEGVAPTPSPPAVAPMRFSSDDLLCAPDYVQTPEQLSYCMELAARLQHSATGLSREVASDIQQVFSDLGGGQNQIPVAGEISVLFGAMFWIIYSEREAAGAVYPSVFTDIEARVSRDPILEDDSTSVSVSATVTAASLGYDMQKQILDGIGEAKKLIDTFGDFDFTTGTALDDVATKLAPKFARRIRDTDIDGLKIPAASFQPITLSDTTWLDTRVVSGDAVQVVDGARYVGRLAGTATLSVRTKDGKFGDDQIAAQIGVEVGTIQITISPDDVVLPPDAVKTFDVTVANAKHPDMVELFRTAEMQGQAEITLGEDGHHTVLYVAPADPEPTPDRLYVRHTSMEGARAASESERVGDATIRFATVTLAPVLDCVDPGEEVPLQATVTGLESYELAWTASAGDVDDAGVFQAPPEVGPVEITVAVVGHPELTDDITVNVGGCVCGFTVSVAAGGTYVGQSGDMASYLAFETGDGGQPWAIASVELRGAGGATATFGVDIGESLVTGPGSYPLEEIGGTLGYGFPGYASYAVDPDLGTLEIYEFDPHTVLTGAIVNGLVRDAGDPDAPPFAISATFRIFPGAGPFYNVYDCSVTEGG